MCDVQVSTTKKGSMLERSDTKNRVRIIDAGENELFRIERALKDVVGIKANVEWLSGTELTVAIVEYGSTDVSDELSRALAPSGERELDVIAIKLNRDSGRFALARSNNP